MIDDAIPWPAIRFRPRSVTLGTKTEIFLVPHLGEFDQGALFQNTLAYELPVFRWLETFAAERYDLVIEIGANIGVYSVFFDHLIRANRGTARLRRVISFEPALEPFSRLLENLRVNGADAVLPFRAAIGGETKFTRFYEPKGHLTNGSLLEDFAAIFSSDISETVIHQISAAELAGLFEVHERALIKIDAEGCEPTILASMAQLLHRHSPDLILEVLPETAKAVNDLPCLKGWSRYLIGPSGLDKSGELYGDPHHRDWFLTRGAWH